MKSSILAVLAQLTLLGATALPLAHAATPEDLPSLDALVDYKPKIPLRIYTSDNVLIGEFGQERRDFVPIKDIPLIQRRALLAIEDSRFYEHGGVDFKGVARAVVADLTGGLKQGASTITMQVARDFFLTKEKLFSRKFTEVRLAYKIENTLTKDQILELYMNQIYLGQRAYGFGSAARIYFGKPLKDLSLAQAAMLAGLPQAPSSVNPVVNPKRAKLRQQLVLKRMLDLGYITEAQRQTASKEDLHVINEGQSYNSHALYVAEMVRQAMYAQFKDDIYTMGISVTTTLVAAEQDAAFESVRRNLLAYDQRHGYRGPEDFVALPAAAAARKKAIDAVLQKHPASDNLVAAVAVNVSPKSLRAVLPNGDEINIAADGLRMAAPALAFRATAKKLKPGSVIRVIKDTKGHWSVTQLPSVGAALVALNNQTGAFRALVGGFDFNASQFNHVTQAWRQPGSAIKPFIYSAALEKGFSPGTLVNDAPLQLSSAETGGGPSWQPQNDDGVYDGPITLRTALAKSKNVPAVRLLRAITPPYAHDFLSRFGFDPAKQPLNYTLTLGTGSVTPLQMAVAYSAFANGGYQVTPYLIQRVVDGRRTVLFDAKPTALGPESVRVVDARNAFIMDSMLHEVTSTGTGALATQKLRRSDLAGKTGTSSDAVDGWFAGYSGATTAVAWMGYDEPQSLGGREFGATVALPMWIDYMRVNLVNKPPNVVPQPAGVAEVLGDWVMDEFVETGGVRRLDLDPSPSPTPQDATPIPAASL